MTRSDLVLALLDTSSQIADAGISERFRGLTVSWTRYGYQDALLESNDVDALLQRAMATGARYCFILPYGVILYECWRLDHGQPRDFFEALNAWAASHEFLATGTLLNGPHTDSTLLEYGFHRNACLLVDLAQYDRLGQPRFELDSPPAAACSLPKASATFTNAHVDKLVPTGESGKGIPRLAGWRLAAASLNAGLTVSRLDESLHHHTLDLGADSFSQREALVPFFGAGIHHYRKEQGAPALTADQCRFLNVIKTQAENARRGVFLWNIESYDDIESPSDGFVGPVSSLYSVAAGFKPNRILETHGFDSQTRVVFFDYSPPALEVRKFMLDQWDGTDFPGFLREIFARFPRPETFYQLWNEVTPDDDIAEDICRIWERELSAWGGATAFADHWRRYRELEHHFVCANILAEPQSVFDMIESDAKSDSIIWWSNAFFTMFGNWFYSLEHRQQAYATWAEELAKRDPQLFLLGSDQNNTCVNSVRAADYWEQYRRAGTDCLRPFKMHRNEIRM